MKKITLLFLLAGMINGHLFSQTTTDKKWSFDTGFEMRYLDKQMTLYYAGKPFKGTKDEILKADIVASPQADVADLLVTNCGYSYESMRRVLYLEEKTGYWRQLDSPISGRHMTAIVWMDQNKKAARYSYTSTHPKYPIGIDTLNKY